MKDPASPPAPVPAAPSVQDRFPTAYTILFALIILMAVLTWILPAGQYQRAANEALGKDAPVPGTYQTVEPAQQGVFDVLLAPITGFYNQSTGMANAIDVSLFVLVIGGFLGVVNATGAINTGIERVMLRLKGREKWMIPALMLLFAAGGSTYGMAEETLAFYVLLIPLMIAVGYDALTGRATFRAGFTTYTTTHFDAETFTVRNGPQLGGSARQATTIAGAPISVRWTTATTGNVAEGDHGVMRFDGEELQSLTRTVIETGNPPPNPVKNYHPAGFYWDPTLSGIGYGVDIRGDTLFAGIYASDGAGLDTWSITTGAMTSGSLYQGRVQNCSKATGSVVCTDAGAITMQFTTIAIGLTTALRINVTLPNGATTTLQPYTR